MAEGEGFEPSVQALIPYSGLANRRFRPLSHPSIKTAAEHRLLEVEQDGKRHYGYFQVESGAKDLNLRHVALPAR